MRLIVLIPYLAVVSGICSNARADIIQSTRQVDFYVSFSDAAAFSDALVSVRGITTIAAGSSGSAFKDLGFPPGNTGVNLFTTGNVSFSGAGAYPGGTEKISGTLTATGAGTLEFTEAVPVSDDPNSYPLTSLTFQGHHGLEFFSPSAGILDQHGTWTTNVYLPGNWSTAGGGQGNHVLLYLDPLWTITQDFTFDPITNRTLFSVLNTDYPGETSYDSGPYPDLILIGSPVPEPATFVAAGMGILVIWALSRKRTRPRIL